MKRSLLFTAIVGLGLTALFGAGSDAALAQGSVALSGNVTSQEEGKMEGVWPTEFDTKKIVMDPTTTNTVIWMANKRTARISKVGPRD
jgi:hypothetical protein